VVSRAERLVRAVLPGSVRHAIKVPVRAVERRLLVGDRLECPICGGRFRRFLPRYGHPDQQCPACHSLVRHRAMWLYLVRDVRIEERSMRILHLAPEVGIAKRIRATGADYVNGDIDAALASERIDVTAIPYPDRSFDLVICSHVLEHVPDDRTAIAELARVVRSDGLALIVVPIKRPDTIEFRDPSPTPAMPDGYLRTGRHGHVREIGADYIARLADGGFHVDAVDGASTLSPAERARYAIWPGETFFVCRVRQVAAPGQDSDLAQPTAAAANEAMSG
jgi:SAM-dependent methyltransferase